MRTATVAMPLRGSPNLMPLSDMDFSEQARNVVFVGGPGTRKTIHRDVAAQ